MSKTKLLIVWTNGDKEVAMKLPLLYGSVILERGYWEEAHLMIWGPSIKLAAADAEVQARLKQMQESGVTMSACIVCTEDYEATDALAALGVENTHTGEMLTACLKDDSWAVMTV
ncbi:DsrE family protein [Sulfurimonas sp. HSL-3221]|uniref:DsrE family protein n=1 Tax=Sulfurimonadaceae TaxID=2771471 RepID=UPI001E3AEC39|nr:DsrE family protein [Sulfurimonas sp. HSL-3221]UFS63659.1 DsrE family protein [Sulfurimonas sp. HSL-3221]